MELMYQPGTGTLYSWIMYHQKAAAQLAQNRQINATQLHNVMMPVSPLNLYLQPTGSR